MDKMSLETYHVLARTSATQIGTGLMKHLSKIVLSSFLCLGIGNQFAHAASKHHAVHHSGGGGGGGGVVLQSPNPVTPIDHNNRGVELGSKGLWPDAIREHEVALSMQPGNKEFRTNLSSAQLRYGNVLFRSNKPYEAMKQFRGALFVDPDNLPADEGLDECYRKMSKNPIDIQFRRRMAEDFETSGHFEDAIVEYRKVLKMDDSGKSHSDLGYVLLKADKPVDGFQELRIAVQKNWTNDQKNELAQVHRKLGDILMEYAYKAHDTGRGTIAMKRLLNASTEYRRAVTLNPADAQAVSSFVEVVRQGTALKPTFDNYLMLGGAYVLAADFAHAKLAYEQCFKLDRSRTELGPARLAFHQAVARSPLSSDELIAESIGKVNKMLEGDPENPRMLYILGRLKQHQGDTNGAVEAYRRAEKINHLVDPDLEMQLRVLGAAPAFPTFGGAQAAQAMARGGGGGPATGAIAAAGVAAAPIAPATPQVDPRNLETYSKIESMLSRDPDGALTLVDTVLERNPADGHAWMLKGSALRKKDMLDDAAVAIRQAAAFKEPEAAEQLLQIDTIRVQPNIQRADQATQAGKFTDAFNELSDAIVKAPKLPVLHRKLSAVMLQMGDKSSADRELDKANQLEKGK